MEVTYNCWHGCHKKSEGCMHCYVYRRDESIGKDSNVVTLNKDYNLPIRRNRKGEYKYPSGTEFDMCFSSDFLIEEADAWRQEVLSFIKERNDCSFFCITKRPERIKECIPDIDTYDNLVIYCTMENQKRVDERAPIYLKLPLKQKGICIEPMLERVNLDKYIELGIDQVTVGGESGDNARPMNFDWVKEIRETCIKNGISFYFHQTGAKLIKDGKTYLIDRKFQHSQAAKAFKD